MHESEPLEAVSLHSGAGLSEDTLSESETRSKRCNKALTLKAPRPASANEAQETQALLRFRDGNEDRQSRIQR